MNKTILNQNLEALRALNPQLVEQLRALATEAEELEFIPTKQGLITARYRGTYLASKIRPRDEAERLAASFDPAENSVAVVLGFGLGHHVKAICDRLAGTGIVIVFEPDLPLLRAVLGQTNCAKWLAENDVFFFSAADCQPEINTRLDKLLAIVAQGASILSHVPSRNRLGEAGGIFSNSFAEALAAMRTTLSTTLVHSVTTCRNLCLNLDHYGTGPALAPLKDWAVGHGAVLVAAGPSLARNVALLEDAKIRERIVIIAVQTALKPLLARGIRPHFVTALDYHEISKQFYEGLTAEDVQGITLVCEPKANRAILESFPGTIRCVDNRFLNQLLGPLAREMGCLRAGATVAHLNFVLAQYLGCDPIVFIGQDLGFTEGLYYGPGAAIHEQWAPELNRFNTIEMMEWQRVTRMKAHLRIVQDQLERPILVDEQMATYLKLFESEFAAAPQRLIDATEGGTRKRYTEILPLRTVLAELREHPPLPPRPESAGSENPNLPTRKKLRDRLHTIRRQVVRLGNLSDKTATLLEQMFADQTDNRKMNAHFDRMEDYRAAVDAMPNIMELVGGINQLGIFNRLKADRALKLAGELDEMTRQKRQLERDKTNVVWIGDACREFTKMLEEADRVLTGQSVDPRISRRITDCAESFGTELSLAANDAAVDARAPIAALIAVDPQRNGLLLPRGLEEIFCQRTVLQGTLERLDHCRTFQTIILLVPAGFDVAALLELERITTKQVLIREISSPLYDNAHAAIAAGRRWSDSCWRGGIGGLTIFDEIICPVAMHPVMVAEKLAGALIVGPDWPLVDPSAETGCDALVTRYREHPSQHNIVFSQAPPGLVGCVITTAMMADLAHRNRRTTLGALLSYIPDLPQRDPATMELCVKLPAAIRNRAERITFDSAERRARLRGVFASGATASLPLDPTEIFTALDHSAYASPLPQQVEIELCTQRAIAHPELPAAARRVRPTPISLELIEKIADELAARDDVALALRGLGDPILHPQFPAIVRLIRQRGISALQVQTDLLESAEHPVDLLELPLTVISVNLNADRAAVHRRALHSDKFPLIITQLEKLINQRHAKAGQAGGLTIPWIVPTLCRYAANLEDLQSFFDRWSYFLNAAVLEPSLPVTTPPGGTSTTTLIPVPIPPAARQRMDRHEMLILADGTVPLDSDDRIGTTSIGNVNTESIAVIWERLGAARRKIRPAGDPVISAKNRAVSSPVIRTTPQPEFSTSK